MNISFPLPVVSSSVRGVRGFVVCGLLFVVCCLWFVVCETGDCWTAGKKIDFLYPVILPGKVITPEEQNVYRKWDGKRSPSALRSRFKRHAALGRKRAETTKSSEFSVYSSEFDRCPCLKTRPSSFRSIIFVEEREWETTPVRALQPFERPPCPRTERSTER